MNTALVSVSGLCKNFGKVAANRNVSLDFHPGRIKALLGENGAGKSTLMSMLAGRLTPDSGTILVNGAVTRFKTPRDALRAGIGMVYQHFMLIERMTVAENILLGQEGRFWLGPAAMRRAVGDLAERYGLYIDPAARVNSLSMGERQRVEILKLLRRDSRLLIFDEPTAVLTPGESALLFEAFRRMAALGKSIVFISHKLKEVLDVADEIAILRRGEVVDEFAAGAVPDKAYLAARMIGRGAGPGNAPPGKLTGGLAQAPARAAGKTPHHPAALADAPEVLSVRNLRAPGLNGVSLSLRKGEILAVAGVAGNGQKELIEILAGLARHSSGLARILGADLARRRPAPPGMGGTAYIPEDRRGLATCPNLSLTDNVLLTARGLFSRGPLLLRSAAQQATRDIIAAYSVRPDDPFAPARALSGGNLQRLVIGRELLRAPVLILAENPTQGLDVAATEDVWLRLKKAGKNAGVLLVSGDLDEVLCLADRIAVMYRGEIVDSFNAADKDKVAAIGLMMAGMVPDGPDRNILT